MNIYQIKNVNHVNMVILKPKMKNVYIVEVKDMEVLVVMNVDINSMKMRKKQIILFARLVFPLVIIILTIIIIIITIIIVIIIIFLILL